MHIIQSTLAQRSSHLAQSQRETSATLRAWVGDRRPDFSSQTPTPQTGSGNDTPAPPRPLVAISLAALAAQQNDGVGAPSSNAGAPSQATSATGPTSDADGLDARFQLLKAVIERLTGQTIHLFNPRDIGTPQGAAVAPAAQAPSDTGNGAPLRRAGFGVEYDAQETVRESETTTFAADGQVQTADGRTIDFQVSLTMNRQFEATSRTSLRLGDAKLKDPLVLNFAGNSGTNSAPNSAQLSDLKVAFDLNGDGQQESLPFVASGSGFLVFDRNGDGQVNDGHELFGPTSGNGFAELAALDADGNGWIDAADPAFARLGTWSLGANGPVFKSLAAQGVGALSTTGQATPFDLKDGANRLQARIRATGVALQESGATGTIQQVDVAA